MAKLEVVDPHFHLWDVPAGNYPWLEKPSTGRSGDNTAIARTYEIVEYLAESGPDIDVVKAVFVEAIPVDPIMETRYVQAAADGPGRGLPQGIVAHADLSADTIRDVLTAHCESPNMRGIRQILNWHKNSDFTYTQRQLMDDPNWHTGFALLKQFNLSFDMQIYPGQAAQGAALAAQHPDQLIIINHAGMWVDRTLAGWREWRDGLRTLAREPNIAIKLSGFGMQDMQWTLESIRPLILETIDAFGTQRSMFASNFPVDKLYSDFPTVWKAFDAIVRDFSETERAALFRTNAERLYRI